MYIAKTQKFVKNSRIPQNRERIYIVAFREKKDFDKFQMPMPTTLDKTIKDIFNFNTKVDDKYYYTEGKYKGNIYKNTVYQWRRKYNESTKLSF